MKAKSLMTICLAVAILLAVSSVAQATLSWQTTPILGTETSYDGDVLVNTGGSPWVTIPHYSIVGDPLYHVGSPSMTVFSVGQTVDAGSGIYYAPEGGAFHWSVLYDGPTRDVLYVGDYPGDSGEGFVMNYLDPVSTLTAADIGLWHYTETWTGGTDLLTYFVDFTVVPEPATIGLLGLGALSLLRRKRLA